VRTLVWIILLATVGLMFDGYDLVVYGTVVSTFLRDPSHIGAVDPALAGALGSYALIGVLVGALIAGSIGDFLGRRKMMLGAYAWFSLGMLATSFTHTAQAFGIFRFLTGLGVGVLLATTAALVSEFAPKGRKNLCNAITYSGVPLGSLAAAAIAIVLLEHIGWRGLFAIGALPLVTLLPLAIWKMPESVVWLVSRGGDADARRGGGGGRAGGGRLCRALRGFPAADDSHWPDERHRPASGLFAQHLAAGADAARGVQRQGVALLPAGAERCGGARADRRRALC
jgi:AAHS family benzoate transporter-like MFS transporter